MAQFIRACQGLTPKGPRDVFVCVCVCVAGGVCACVSVCSICFDHERGVSLTTLHTHPSKFFAFLATSSFFYYQTSVLLRHQAPCSRSIAPRLASAPYSAPLAMAFNYKHLDLSRSSPFTASLPCYSLIAREVRGIRFQTRSHTQYLHVVPHHIARS